MPLALQRRCAGCHRPFDGHPVFRRDTGYCCTSCAEGALCTCFMEVDLAGDGVDRLGLPFAVELNPARGSDSPDPVPSR